MKCKFVLFFNSKESSYKCISDTLLNYLNRSKTTCSYLWQLYKETAIYHLAGECENSVECDLLNNPCFDKFNLINVSYKYHINIEYYSIIEDQLIQEHGIIKDGQIIYKECKNFYTYNIIPYDDFNKFKSSVFIDEQHYNHTLEKCDITDNEFKKLFNKLKLSHVGILNIGLYTIDISNKFKNLIEMENI